MDYKILRPRQNPRLQNYDYKTANHYFVTVCTHHKQCVFGAAGKPNVVGQMAAQGRKDISRHFPGVGVDEYVIMPNHVHMILVFPQEQCNLSAVVGSYKSYVSKMFHVEHFCSSRLLSIINLSSFHKSLSQFSKIASIKKTVYCYLSRWWRGEGFSFGQVACAPRGPEAGRGVSTPPSLPLDSTLPATS